jgi:hypothetical protein
MTMIDDAACAVNASKPVLRLKFGPPKVPAVPTVEPMEPVHIAPQAKPPRGRPPRSTLVWPSRDEMFPAVRIKGEPVPLDRVETYTDKKAADLASKVWTRRVAFEVAKGFPEDRREAVEWFCLRHRLSIVCAFHRRLARVDVVAAITAMYRENAP